MKFIKKFFLIFISVFLFSCRHDKSYYFSGVSDEPNVYRYGDKDYQYLIVHYPEHLFTDYLRFKHNDTGEILNYRQVVEKGRNLELVCNIKNNDYNIGEICDENGNILFEFEDDNDFISGFRIENDEKLIQVFVTKELNMVEQMTIYEKNESGAFVITNEFCSYCDCVSVRDFLILYYEEIPIILFPDYDLYKIYSTDDIDLGLPILLGTHIDNEVFPFIVDLHGGFWIVGDAFSEYWSYDAPRPRKCACVSVNYSLTTPMISKVAYSDMIEDIRLAVRYLAENAEVLHLDVSRMGMSGSSAGGHLALLYSYMSTDGTLHSDIPVKFVIDDCGPCDFTDPNYFINDDSNALRSFHLNMIRMLTSSDLCAVDIMNGKYNSIMRDASPYCHITFNAPPTIIGAGGKDYCVPVSNPERLRDKLRENGVRCEYVFHPDGEHCCLMSEDTQDFVYDMFGVGD